MSGNQFKAYLLEDIINQLNIELEELSKSLFDNRIIKISCDNKLDILLDDKYYEQLSGGEQRKCDIGLIIAQRKLAQKMKSVSSNILIMDDIFDALITANSKTYLAKSEYFKSFISFVSI